MKKLLLLSLALLICSALLAQGSGNTVNKHSFLSFHAGPSFPVGAFGSNNPGNDDAGLAKTGYTIAINYGYRFKSPLGLEAAVFYNHFGTQKMVLTVDVGDGTRTIDMTLDDWHLYGISVGPSLEFSPAKKMSAGFHVMGGIANVRLPAFYFDGEDATKADWGIGPVVQAGLNLKIDASKQVFVFFNGDYQYMRPVFNVLDLWTDESEKAYQKISVLQASAGIGFRF